MTLFGDKVITDAVKMKSYWRRVGPTLVWGRPGEVKAGTGTMQLQATKGKHHQPKASKDVPLQVPGGACPWPHLNF